jgi:AcrR family transcriptional regulator
MVLTPWGDSSSLREEMLSPGPSNSAAAVAGNQRRRLFAALVASISEKGYENTRISDLVEISGVSLRSFYDLFADKDACLMAALEALVSDLDLQPRLAPLASFAASQPAAARMALIDAYVADPAAAEIVDGAVLRGEGLVREWSSDTAHWEGLPAEMATLAVAGLLGVFRSRLISGQAHRIPTVVDELAGLMSSYGPPARPLRAAARPPEVRPEEREASDHAERALRAFEALLAEQRYAKTTMEQIAKRAGMSVRTLYANFASREELMLAAIDSAGALVVATTLPAFRRAPSAPEGIRVSLAALFNLLASRPNLAHLLLVAAFEGGAPAYRRRAEALRPLEALLSRAAPYALPVPRALVAETVFAGIFGLARRRLLEGGPSSLPGLAPICTYVALAPLLGSEQATAAAEGKSYRRPPPDDRTTFRLGLPLPKGERVTIALSHGALGIEELARKAGLPREETEVEVERLIEVGHMEAISSEGRRLYRSRWPVVGTADWERLDQSERERVSAAIGGAIREEVESSAAAGVFDSRPDRYLVRLPIWVDEQGWRELSSALEATLETCFDIQRRSQERLDRSGGREMGFPARVLLVSYEVPPG